jgi:hypothetical protein
VNRIQATNHLIRMFPLTRNAANQIVSAAAATGCAAVDEDTDVIYDFAAHTYDVVPV